MPDAGALARLALAAGFQRAGVVDPHALARQAARLVRLREAARHPGTADLEPDWVLESDRWARSATVLVGLLCYHRDEPDDPSVAGDPCALVAPFARRNWYRGAVRLLQGVARGVALSAGIPASSVRILCNSRVPEKPLAVAAGLAAYGAHSLLIAPGIGSLFVVAAAVFPFAVDPPPARLLDDPCGGCRRCIDACPVGAIVDRGVLDPDRCLQGWAGRPGPLPPQVRGSWGARLYGCQVCQDACPLNRGVPEGPPLALGEIGAGVPIARVLDAGPGGMPALFRGTALGMRWVDGEALVRSALLAAGHRADAAGRLRVARYLADPSAELREAAAWALARINRA